MHNVLQAGGWQLERKRRTEQRAVPLAVFCSTERESRAAHGYIPVGHFIPGRPAEAPNETRETGRDGEWALPRAAHSRSNAHFTRAHHFYITPSLVVGDQRPVSRWEMPTSVSGYDFVADPKWSHTTKCFEYQLFTSQVK